MLNPIVNYRIHQISMAIISIRDENQLTIARLINAAPAVIDMFGLIYRRRVETLNKSRVAYRSAIDKKNVTRSILWSAEALSLIDMGL